MPYQQPKRLKVQIKLHWGQPWVDAPNLQCMAMSLCVAPAVSQATFEVKYGLRKDPGVALREVIPFGGMIADWYVRLVDSVTNNNRWVGTFSQFKDKLHGADVGVPSGDEVLTAFGLERLLHRSEVEYSWILLPGKAKVITRIQTLLPFNMRVQKDDGKRVVARLVGNRSAAKFGNSYVFSQADGCTWTNRDIAEYLMDRFAPAFFNGQPLTGQVANLAALERAWRPFRTVGEGLTALIDRRRGHTWRIAISPALDPTPVVQVCTVFDVAVPLSNRAVGAMLEPNGNMVNLDLDDETEKHWIGDVTIHGGSDSEYHRVVVRGSPLVVCGTVSFATGTLNRAWDDQAETAYAAATDIDRENKQRFEGIYTDFVLNDSQPPFEFDKWVTSTGEDGTTPTAEPAIALQKLPLVDLSGQIQSSPTAWSHLFGLGRTLLRQLPLLAGCAYDDAAGPYAVYPDAPEEYVKPMVFVQMPGTPVVAPSLPIDAPTTMLPGVFVKADKINDSHVTGGAVGSPISISVMDSRMGFKLHTPAGFQHELASGHFTGESAEQPFFDYATLAATVAIATDAILSVEQSIQTPGDITRTLIIDCPECEAWYLMAGTIVDVQEGVPVLSPAGMVLRNDSDKLLTIAALARAWYGRVRTAATVTQAYARYDVMPGAILQTVTFGGQVYQVQTLVSRVSWDFTKFTTTIESDFGELDFLELGGAGQGGGPGMMAGTLFSAAGENIVRLAAPQASTGKARWGQVLSGASDVSPAQTTFYWQNAGVNAGYYFEEVNPQTLQKFNGSASRDDSGVQKIVHAIPFADSENTDFQALRGNAYFQFAETGPGVYKVLRPPIGLFPVKVGKTGGDAGDLTTQCSFVYAVWDRQGNVLGTNMTPLKPRPALGPLVAQTGSSHYGLGFYDGSAFYLWTAGEVEDVEAC